MARLIDGRAVAQAVRDDVARGVAAYTAASGRVPGLATVLVGEDPASEVYVRNKVPPAEEAGMESFHEPMPVDSTQEQVEAMVDRLNADDRVDGILVQSPLPKGLDFKRVLERIDPAKDVDGFHPLNVGRLVAGRPALVPCTPAGVMELLRRSETHLEGAEAVVVGRSDIVGKPVALLLLHESATVTVCHSRTRDLPAVPVARTSWSPPSAARGMITGDMVKPGATVIDVGINRTEDGLVGDVDFEPAAKVAGAITPVPGGVGPMTIAMLMRNTLTAAPPADGRPVCSAPEPLLQTSGGCSMVARSGACRGVSRRGLHVGRRHCEVVQ